MLRLHETTRALPYHAPVALTPLPLIYHREHSFRRVVERRADLALALGRPEEALRLLSSTAWPREHQRYVGTELWWKARAALGEENAPIPEELGEDTLAPFGAHWSS